MNNTDFKEEVVLVGEDNIPLGTMAKADVHTALTPLHRGFSVYLFDRKGNVLLQQRSHLKRTWPLVWSNSCCGHPGLDESVEQAIRRRVRYELGIVSIGRLEEILPDFRYSCVRDGVMENEICPVWAGSVGGESNLNPDEVEAIKWKSWEDLALTIQNHPGAYSEWCELQISELNRLPRFREFVQAVG